MSSTPQLKRDMLRKSQISVWTIQAKVGSHMHLSVAKNDTLETFHSKQTITRQRKSASLASSSSMNELGYICVYMQNYEIRLWLWLRPKALYVCGSHELFFGRLKVQFGVLQILMSAFGPSKWVNTCV